MKSSIKNAPKGRGALFVRTLRRMAPLAMAMLLAVVAVATPSCGGGAGGDAAGRGLVLLNFSLNGVDNAVLNEVLLWEFSGSVDPATISEASIQIREGPAFGLTVSGVFIVEGATVRFEPQLPTVCDLSDGAFKPDTTYRVQTIGFPEQFAIRNSAGQSLDATVTFEFGTRAEDDPTKYRDQVPGVGPAVTAMSPDDMSQGVAVADGNRVVFDISENLDPCSIDDTTILVSMYESGDPDVFAQTPAPYNTRSGFSDDGTNDGDTSDQQPGDAFTWGSGGNITTYPPQKILADIELVQSVAGTQIIVTPQAGRFPENALMVVEVTVGVRDFGNQPMTPVTCSFTTENLDSVQGVYLLKNEGETAYQEAGTTADVDTERAPNRVQGFMLFSGDADNGAFQEFPSNPNIAPACTEPLQENNGIKDVFDPPDGFVLDTGSTPNTCPNETDGSTAVVWEFLSFTIRSGVTVRVVGVNPAIILVEGDVNIDSGGTLLVRGDGNASSPEGDGTRGLDRSSGGTDKVNPGGIGVAGGGDGGDATKVENNNQDWKYGHDGLSGFGSDDYDPAMPQITPLDDNTTEEPLGAGQGGAPAGVGTSSPWDGGSEAGGGGGHSSIGQDSQHGHVNPTNWVLKLARRGKGGKTYGDDQDPMLTPLAGSGGGAAGHAKDQPWRSSTSEGVGGGSGAAGGGFVDLTSSGNISVFGTIDAAGGRGGNGRGWRTEANPDRGVSGGGGGGSGGGIRLLTPRDIILGATTLITAAGGAGGIGTKPFSVQTRSNGGMGGSGRIAMEDSDSIISGQAAAAVVPAEGDPGFYRGTFDATRFKGGGLRPVATTEVFAVGPFNPDYEVPAQTDFIAGLPAAGAPGNGKTGILIEMRGSDMGADALPNPASETDWFSVGYFKDIGVENLPEWNLGHPGDVTRAPDNSGDGIDNLDGKEFIQIRISIYLKETITVVDPGGLLDDWTIRFSSDQ